ncbi:dihydrolipoamide acetyltransferase family protein [Kribbella sp. NPDC051770]|uniref:dihydrolipoamide acetyltransferase family protein n=1 Tax=Kribbella sp. NPDC051770 TaxID=3155413 RepID=UPI003438B90F
MNTFLLPDLGEGLTEAEIVRWLVAVGDVIAVDSPIAEVETAKSLVEVPSPYAGVVTELHGAEGTTVPVGKPLITIGSTDGEAYREEEKAGSGNVLIGYGTPESAGTGRRRKPRVNGRVAVAERVAAAPAAPAPAAVPAAPAAVPAPAVARAVPLVISPLVRRIANDAGLDLRTIEGSGAGGLIVRRDVESAIATLATATDATATDATATDATATDATTASSAGALAAGSAATRATSAHPTPSSLSPGAAASATSDVLAGLSPSSATDSRTGLPELRRTTMNAFRKTVATTLSRSRAEIPEATTWVDVDATALIDLRASLRTATDQGPGLLALMARFVIAGLRKHPELNGYVDGDDLVQYDGVNLGLAAQTDRGLLVPAVPNAHTLTTRELDTEIRRLTTAAREGKLTNHELTSGSFTLNNYGSFGVDGSAAIINHPQVAILGVGRIIDRPWVVDGELAVRKLTQLSLVFDHRVCDGGTAAAFLRFVADAFENPASAFADL